MLLRLAGKRMLSQLNTFDLVVVLLLSNVVQNAIIGPDNSLLGGLIGACFLVAMNAIWERVATSSKVLQGSPTTLVRDGVACSASSALSCDMDSLPDALIGRTTTEIGHRPVDLCIGRPWMFL